MMASWSGSLLSSASLQSAARSSRSPFTLRLNAHTCRTLTSSRRVARPELGPTETAQTHSSSRPPRKDPVRGRWLMYAGAFTAAAGLFAYARPAKPLHADDAQASSRGGKTHGKGPMFSKDDVSLLCVIGYPKSGKTTQCKNLEKRWGKEGWTHVQAGTIDELREVIEREQKAARGKRTSLIVDGFPTSLQEAHAIESEICKIFCYAYFGFEQEDFTKRTGRSAQDYQELYKVQQPLREMPREEGNILEIVAAWPQDEVWEQVEAKVEQVIELREMGEM